MNSHGGLVYGFLVLLMRTLGNVCGLRGYVVYSDSVSGLGCVAMKTISNVYVWTMTLGMISSDEPHV